MFFSFSLQLDTFDTGGINRDQFVAWFCGGAMVMGKTLKKCANKMSMVKRIGPNLLLNATRCDQVRRAVKVRL